FGTTSAGTLTNSLSLIGPRRSNSSRRCRWRVSNRSTCSTVYRSCCTATASSTTASTLTRPPDVHDQRCALYLRLSNHNLHPRRIAVHVDHRRQNRHNAAVVVLERVALEPVHHRFEAGDHVVWVSASMRGVVHPILHLR